jgi:6-pyruvoyltetrahydropterin/6-carboxytetrahydropterin synthase
MKYQSHKTYTHAEGWSCAFRQWKADHSHCHYLHGYALQVELTFEAEALDHRNWVVDFGGLKGLKKVLQSVFDHTTLIAEDDPELGWFEAAHQRGILD